MKIRPIAIGILRRNDQILVFEGSDSVKNETFYRPCGGGIEFGETAEQALVREFREELNLNVKILNRIAVLENIFTCNGVPGHEIVFVFEIESLDREIYSRSELEGVEDNGEKFRCLWKPLSDFRNGSILYPTGLVDSLS
ncbi:MAG: NUDIX hydrolase [Candidatus Wallbacteria bacterium]|nr:NUDIX hydrolase [Candidatus Wallbacteria bacterium]